LIPFLCTCPETQVSRRFADQSEDRTREQENGSRRHIESIVIIGLHNFKISQKC
jgi:hypothetical protein